MSKLLGSFFQIPLQNIAGDEVLGIFRLVFPVYMIALTLSVAGVPLAISKLIAELNEKNKQKEIAKLFTSASIIGIAFGVFGCLVIVLFSIEIANMLGGQETRMPLLITSLALLIAPYMAVYRGYFQGFGDMKPTGVSQVIEQFVRVFFMLIIAYILVSWDKSNTVITSGAMVGSFLGVISSLIYLRIKYNRSPYYNKSNSYSLRDLRENGKKDIAGIDPNRYRSFINATFKFSRLAYNTACITRIINRNSRTIWNIQSRFCIHANNCYFCKCNCISVNTTLNFRIGQKEI